MKHRHLDYPEQTPVAALGMAALDDLLDRGDLHDWAPLARAVAADADGVLAQRVLRLVDAHATYGTSLLWRSWIQRLRDRRQPPAAAVPLRALRQRTGVTQRQLAEQMGVAQPDVSRLERRGDAKVSTLRAYAAATGATLRLIAEGATGEVEISLGPSTPKGDAAAGTSPRGLDRRQGGGRGGT